jgi:hypothetical protein
MEKMFADLARADRIARGSRPSMRCDGRLRAVLINVASKSHPYKLLFEYDITLLITRT